MGKYLNLYPPKDAPSAGWSEWDVTGSEGYREYDFHLNQNGQLHRYGRAPADYLTDVLGARGESFIDSSSARGRPFLLEVATYAPHLPATPAPADVHRFPGLTAPRGPEWDRLPRNAPRWLARYPRLSNADIARLDAKFRRRVQAVQEVDRMIGRLRSDLARRGVLDNTYFVFSSDNGFHLGQRRMLAGKQTAYDTDVRVPLVVTGPGVPAGRRVSAMTSSIDLAPTFEQIAGAHPRYSRDGESLLGLWHGQRPPASRSNAVLIEHRSGGSADDPDWQGSRSGNGPSYEALRTADALYVEYVTGDREYYDLRRDPLEMNNIVGELSPSRAAALHRMLAQLARCRGSGCRAQVAPG
jgi:arylsulfatase A-like enzyme